MRWRSCCSSPPLDERGDKPDSRESAYKPSCFPLGMSRRLALALAAACLLADCVQNTVPGIEPAPATSFFGRRRQAFLPAEQADMAVVFVGGLTPTVPLTAPWLMWYPSSAAHGGIARRQMKTSSTPAPNVAPATAASNIATRARYINAFPAGVGSTDVSPPPWLSGISVHRTLPRNDCTRRIFVRELMGCICRDVFGMRTHMGKVFVHTACPIFNHS